MTCPYDNPWMFHRDEVDLLEEEMDEIYRRYDPASGEPVLYMEDQVLKEQIDTEEQAEAELILQIGPDYFFPTHHHEDERSIVAEEPILEILRAHTKRDPFYERLYLWVDRVFRYASKRYTTEEISRVEVFRVYVNVKMIPIKFVLAQTELMMNHSLNKQIAHKERMLCLTYFERILESLEACTVSCDEESVGLLAEGKLLQRLTKKLLL